jgi:hypothetical protein
MVRPGGRPHGSRLYKRRPQPVFMETHPQTNNNTPHSGGRQAKDVLAGGPKKDKLYGGKGKDKAKKPGPDVPSASRSSFPNPPPGLEPRPGLYAPAVL